MNFSNFKVLSSQKNKNGNVYTYCSFSMSGFLDTVIDVMIVTKGDEIIDYSADRDFSRAKFGAVRAKALNDMVKEYAISEFLNK